MRTIASVWSRNPFESVHVNKAPTIGRAPPAEPVAKTAEDVFVGTSGAPRPRPRIDTDGFELFTTDAEIVAKYNVDPEQLSNEELSRIGYSVNHVTERGNFENDKRIARERVAIFKRLRARDPSDVDFMMGYHLALQDAICTYWFGIRTLKWFVMGWDPAIPVVGKPPPDLLMASLRVYPDLIKDWGSSEVDIACLEMMIRCFEELPEDCREYLTGPLTDAYADLAKRKSSEQGLLARRNRLLAFFLADLRDASARVGKESALRESC